MIKVRRLPFSAASLLLLLQRTPVVRLLATAEELTAPSRIVSLLKSAAATIASLGAVQSLVGATQFIVSSSSVSGTVGTPISPVAFTVTGAQTPAGSYRYTGTLPPGLTVTGANANGIVNASSGSITGTPTTAGSSNISIVAYEHTGASGDSFGPARINFTIAGAAALTPTITAQPAGQSVATGANVTFAVTAAGNPAPTYQWRKNGTNLAGATMATLTLSAVAAANAGDYTVVVSNSAGNDTSNVATLTVTAAGPTFTAQPQSQYVAAGSAVTFSIGASGSALSYQWKKDGVVIPGATDASFRIASASIDAMGFYSVTVNDGASATNSAVATLTVNAGGSSRLVNVSTRGYVPAGGSLTPGFVLQGNAGKTVVIRAVGPTLGSFGVGGTLADPMMDVIPLGGSIAIASNDNWGGAATLQTAFTRVGAFPLAAATSSDASVETSLNATGASGYTVRITSKNATAAGIALAEIYDEESISAPVRLVNVSTSGFVGSGEQALVPGFVIGGTAPKLLLIRAVGPGLAQFGVSNTLADPQLSLVPLGKDFTVSANDNWGNDATLSAAFSQAGAFALPTGSRDAAVVLRLPPGGYTVVVSGVGNTTGTALVEVYDLDP